MTAKTPGSAMAPCGPVLGALLLAGCAGTATHTTAAATGGAPPKTHLLSIVGYNYTDRYIDHFEVNGQGGGNLYTSTPSSGGGSQVCCLSWNDASRLPIKVKVKWAAAYCMQSIKAMAGESFQLRQPYFRATQVEFNGPAPIKPTQFEVHLYPDGHVEANIANEYSPPRLKLPASHDHYVRPGMVVNDPPCPPDYERVKAYNNPTQVDAKTGRVLP